MTRQEFQTLIRTMPGMFGSKGFTEDPSALAELWKKLRAEMAADLEEAIERLFEEGSTFPKPPKLVRKVREIAARRNVDRERFHLVIQEICEQPGEGHHWIGLSQIEMNWQATQEWPGSPEGEVEMICRRCMTAESWSKDDAMKHFGYRPQADTDLHEVLLGEKAN